MLPLADPAGTDWCSARNSSATKLDVWDVPGLGVGETPQPAPGLPVVAGRQALGLPARRSRPPDGLGIYTRPVWSLAAFPRQEPIEDPRFRWPRLVDDLTRHVAGRVAKGACDDHHVIERADDWEELGDEVDG